MIEDRVYNDGGGGELGEGTGISRSSCIVYLSEVVNEKG